MRRQQQYSAPMLLGYALAEIERLKAMATRITDGHSLVYGGGGGGNGGGNGGGAVEPSPHVLYGSKHTKSLKVTAGAALSVDFEEGHVRVDETHYLVAAGNLAGLTDATTNYVFVSNAGAVASNTTGFPNNCIPLATVVTAAGAVSTVTDNRAYLWGHHGPAFAGTVTVDVINEYTAAAGVTIEGSLFKDAVILPSADANYKLYAAAGNPYILVDTNDWLQYVRASNYWSFYIGSVEELRIADGVLYPTITDGGVNFNLAAPGGDPRYTADSGDYMGYWRAGNAFQFIIGSSEYLRVDAGSVRFAVSINTDFYAYADANQSVISFDGGTDQLRYDRAGNYWEWLIGGTAYAQISAAGLLVDDINELTGGAGVTIESNYLEDGQLALGNDASAIHADNVLWLSHTWTGSPGATAKRGVWVDVIYNFGAATTGFNAALRFDAEVLAGNNENFDWLLGCIGSVKVRGTGTKGVVEGFKAQIYADENNAVAGDVIYFSAAGSTTGYTGSTAVGIWGLEINDLGAGFNAISGELVGIEILAQDAKGAATAYGVQIGDITNATTVIPLYQAGSTGANRLVAKTMIGVDTAPDYILHVKNVADQLFKLESTAPGAVGARMDFLHRSASAADWDQIAVQYFYGLDDAGTPNVIDYGRFVVTAVDVSEGTVDGQLAWYTRIAGADTLVMYVRDGQLRLPVNGVSAGLLIGDTQLYRSAANVLRTPDSMIIDGTLEIGTPPIYTPTNVTTTRSFDADATTIDELADVLGTLLADFQAMGPID